MNLQGMTHNRRQKKCIAFWNNAVRTPDVPEPTKDKAIWQGAKTIYKGNEITGNLWKGKGEYRGIGSEPWVKNE